VKTNSSDSCSKVTEIQFYYVWTEHVYVRYFQAKHLINIMKLDVYEWNKVRYEICALLDN
jgi:hypothetical protein